MEKRQILCEYFLNNGIIDEDFLINIGYSEEEINNLINTKILERRGNTYNIISMDYLYNFIKSLDKEKNYNKSTKYLEKCLMINDKYIKFYFKYLRLSINNKDYSKVMEIYEIISNKKLLSKENVNFLLYLLAQLFILPKEYKELLASFNNDDYLDLEDNEYLKKVKLFALKGNFLLGRRTLKEIKDENIRDYKKMLNYLFVTIMQRKNQIKQNHSFLNKIFNDLDLGSKLEDILDKYNLSSNEKCLIYLVFSKNYYLVDNLEIGDYYLRKVENMANKNKIVLDELARVKAKRISYLKNKRWQENENAEILQRFRRKIIK